MEQTKEQGKKWRDENCRWAVTWRKKKVKSNQETEERLAHSETMLQIKERKLKDMSIRDGY